MNADEIRAREEIREGHPLHPRHLPGAPRPAPHPHAESRGTARHRPPDRPEALESPPRPHAALGPGPPQPAPRPEALEGPCANHHAYADAEGSRLPLGAFGAKPAPVGRLLITATPLQQATGFGKRELWALLDETGAREIMLVGHDPDFSTLLAYLIDTAGISMKKGALATIDLHTKLGDGEGELRWLVPPDLLTTK